MKNIEKAKEELQRQINAHERTGGHARPTTQDAQKIIDLLGGKMQVEVGSRVETICYYMTLLTLEKQT